MGYRLGLFLCPARTARTAFSCVEVGWSHSVSGPDCFHPPPPPSTDYPHSDSLPHSHFRYCDPIPRSCSPQRSPSTGSRSACVADTASPAHRQQPQSRHHQYAQNSEIRSAAGRSTGRRDAIDCSGAVACAVQARSSGRSRRRVRAVAAAGCWTGRGRSSRIRSSRAMERTSWA